jgi:hypothetical protein
MVRVITTAKPGRAIHALKWSRIPRARLTTHAPFIATFDGLAALYIIWNGNGIAIA